MIAWAVEALIASAVLMLVVMMVRAPVRRLFGAQMAYALWALPVLRMVMPPLPAMWREQVAMPIARASEAVSVLMVPYDGPALTGAAEPVAALPWGAIVAAAWAMGALAFFVYHFVRHQSFCRRLLRDARTLDEIGGVRVIETAAAAGPLAFGTARRFVAFPCDFADRYDADERALALAHELGHHARGDLIANWAALALLAVHWFNPLAWRAFRAFRCDQELANDARVLAGRSRTDRHIYACAIVKAAHGGAIAATCHLHTIADLKGRLKMLTISRPSRTRLAAGGAAVLGLVAGGLIVTASGTEAAAAITARVESATGVQIVAPAVPDAPAVPVVPAVPAVPARKVTRGVVVIENGKTTTYEGAAAARYIAAHPVSLPPVAPVPPAPAIGIVPPAPPVPPMPVPVDANVQVTVRSGDCQPASGGDTVIRETRNGQRVMVICQNRIRAQAMSAERQASVAVRQAAMAERQAAFAERRAATAKISGLQQAVASIRGARFSIESNRNLTDEQRKVALAGLDEAMAELRSEMQD